MESLIFGLLSIGWSVGMVYCIYRAEQHYDRRFGFHSNRKAMDMLVVSMLMLFLWPFIALIVFGYRQLVRQSTR